MMNKFLLGFSVLLALSCNTKTEKSQAVVTASVKSENAATHNEEQEKKYPVMKTEAEWKAELSEIEYYVLRKKGTERPFTGKYNKFYGDGFYVCAACGIKLYESTYKFDSGTGWPSFDRGVEENIEYETDTSFGMVRTELLCANCGGHLGHVFDDGPPTTGKRHCINSVSLQFIAANGPK